jgi:hypothetical protein
LDHGCEVRLRYVGFCPWAVGVCEGLLACDRKCDEVRRTVRSDYVGYDGLYFVYRQHAVSFEGVK